MREYTVKPTDETPPLTGDTEGPWAEANLLEVDNWSWEDGLDRQETELRALYDEDAITLQYVCEDSHIQASATERHGEVWTDSCVEFFASPTGSPEYVNFEGNCCGTFLLGHGTVEDRRHPPDSVADRITVATSVPGATKEPAPGDDGWWLAVRLPFAAYSAMLDAEVTPESGESWRANCYRIGGGSAYATWNPVDAPDPDFHRPEDFGRFVFA